MNSGDYKVSGGDSTGGRASQFTRSSLDAQTGFLIRPNLPPSIFGVHLETPLYRHGGDIGFLLKAHRPYHCLRDGYRI
jgi:hypothetical protein